MSLPLFDAVEWQERVARCPMRTMAGLLFLWFVVLAASRPVHAVPQPDQIRWDAPPLLLVDDLYRSVLGRPPESAAVVQQWAAQITGPESRYQLFWRFVQSPEYQASPWAQQRRGYDVWFETRWTENATGDRRMCQCYRYSKGPPNTGLRPAYQMTGIPYPAGTLTENQARALLRLYWAADPGACPTYDCGRAGGWSGGGQLTNRFGAGISVDACVARVCPSCAQCVERNRVQIERCMDPLAGVAAAPGPRSGPELLPPGLPTPAPAPVPEGGLFGNSIIPTFDDYMDEIGEQPDATEPAQTTLSDCVCRSTDGRNGTCANNGCVEPENFSGTCYWACRDAEGNSVNIRGRDGQLMP
jgi:hypothetical protein